jgi:hypothetical protein
MKRLALLLLLAASLVVGVPLAHANGDDILLFSFTGFDYENPNTNPSTYLDLGEGYEVVGFLTSADAYLGPYYDPTSYEYTFHLFDETVVARSFVPPFLHVEFSNATGRARYYADNFPAAGTAATYGINPPNATAPSTFIDGSIRIGGNIKNFTLDYNFVAQTGNFQGDMNLDEGADLTYIPVGQRNGWILGGLNNVGLFGNPSVPTGYNHQVEGECYIPGKTPTQIKTWGAVKALYR